MSAEIISLSKARKAQEKAKAAKVTAQNRFKFGRTKTQKALEQLEAEVKVRRLDFSKRDDKPDGKTEK